MARHAAVPLPSTSSFPPFIGFIVAVAILYFAREILIPFALALLISFVLSPIVKRLEGWRIPRAPAALLVIFISFAVMVSIGWVVTGQLIHALSGLPRYSDNIRRKVLALKVDSAGLDQLLKSFDSLNKEASSTPSDVPAPTQVQVVEPSNPIQKLRDFAGGLLKPLGTAGVTIVFTLFMLIDRDDLRNRLLRLSGQGQLHATTKAMDDAGNRVSRYILLQTLVNVGVGVVVGAGLAIAGVQNALLFGVLTCFFRFVPYVGIIVAGMLPFILTIAMVDSWRTPLTVFAIYLFTELITGNILEPMLYGVHTGLSAVAILVTTVFWTVLWGPIGLILSTPLTVCLSALGRYSPQLEFLQILLGDEPVLSRDALFYQRLLALDQRDAFNLLDQALKTSPVITVYDEVILPALSMAEQDRHSGMLEAKREEFLVQSVREFVTELSELDTKPSDVENHPNRVFCLPANDVGDEIAAAMFAQIATQRGYPALAFPVTDTPADLIAALDPQPEDVILVSSVPPLALSHARKVTQEVLQAFPNARIIVGLWNYPMTGAKSIERIRESLASSVAMTMTEAMEELRRLTVA